MPRPRILLIDDDALLARSLVRMLSGGAEVVVCGGVADASAALERALEFDVVLCDVDLGGTSGLALCSSLDAARASRVVYITGGLKSLRDERLVDARGARVLHKPFTRDDVQREIERIHRRAA